MTRILTTIHLSDIQKETLAKVKAAASPEMAWETIYKGPDDTDNNMAGARDVLGDLGLLTIGEGTIELTSKGEDVMRGANLLDDMGELTDEGRELAGRGTDEKSTAAPPPATPPMGGAEGGLPPLDQNNPFPMESLQLFNSVYLDATEIEKMKKIQPSFNPKK